MKTKVSALMDGELEAHECGQVLRALDLDADLRNEWNEFHLLGDALRGESDLGLDVTAKVMAALAAEPTVLAPQPVRHEQWLRPALALAASLAGVAVVGWVALAPSVSPFGDSPQLVKAPTAEPVAQVATGAAINERLQEYLVAHQAHAPVGGLEAGTRYVRTVSAMDGAR